MRCKTHLSVNSIMADGLRNKPIAKFLLLIRFLGYSDIVALHKCFLMFVACVSTY